MSKNRYVRAFSRAWQWLTGITALILFVAWAIENFNLSFQEVFGLFTALGVGVVILFLVIASQHLSEIDDKIDDGFSNLSDKLDRGFNQLDEKLSVIATGGPKKPNPGGSSNPSSNPGPAYLGHQELKRPSESGPEPRPSGGGAFAGMVVGGAIGAAGGPIGVIIGGILGALIGNQIEYNNIQRRRRG